MPCCRHSHTGLCQGLSYLNGELYYHAWVEVFLSTWISVDPTLDQFPADVTHVKFVEGDMEEQIAILRLIGKLEIEILEYL
ncbi:MAG: transglutaminase-like domain-containing protein [Desulfosudis oleivorans]|nr:transglutaminase-like domain-containing protein [Desulfosudis oleivorans]